MNRKIRGLLNWLLSKLYFTDENKSEVFATLRYSAIYLVALIYWEILLRSQIGFEDMTFYFLLFLPSLAVLLASLTGWFKEKLKGNRIITPLVLI